jgi:diaminopropionate ammonia-lyase
MVMFLANRLARFEEYPSRLTPWLSIEAAEQSRAWLKDWDQLSTSPTPLWELPSTARRLGVARLCVKDESHRSPLGSFKALGASVAMVRLIQRLRHEQGWSFESLIAGRHAAQLRDFTVITASDGNHGRSLAGAARSLGCRCVIVLHAGVNAEREQAIRHLGAETVRVSGNYDDSVDEAARLGARNGWHVVSDTSWEGYEEVPRDVMRGYGTIAAEIIEQTAARSAVASPFSHVFLQAGVGGLAAGVASYLWEFYGAARPRFVIVEPIEADCLYQTALSGKPAVASGSTDSIMAGLACGKVSPLAWRILERVADYFVTVEEEESPKAMRQLAAGNDGEVPIVAGETGAAGFAGVLRARGELPSSGIGLGPQSSLLVINTEGATAPGVYAQLVGETAESVRRRQDAWLAQRARSIS